MKGRLVQHPLAYFAIAAIAGAILLVTGLVIFTGDRAEAIALTPDNATIRKHGKQLYAQYCASCHGVKLEGQPEWKTPLENGRYPAPPHDETGHTWHHPDELLFKLTKFGSAQVIGNGHESDMPGFKDQLSDKDILAVLSYIKSTWPKMVRMRHDRLNENAKIN